MITKIIKIENEFEREKIKEVASALRDGKLVVFPTETVYGLGGNGLNEDALKNIYIAKGRPSDNPLILHIADLDMLDTLVRDIPEDAKLLIDKFWPGPLTLIFNRKSIVPDRATGGLDTVAIRMPSDKVAHAILKEAKVPVAAPSANLSGKPSPTSTAHVIEDLDGRVDYIVDSTRSFVGIESTVVDMTVNPPMILRPGYITYEDLKSVIPDVCYDNTTIDKDDKSVPKSPGQKYRHYAPSANCYTYVGDVNLVRDKIKEEINKNKDKKICVIATDRVLKEIEEDVLKLSLGSGEDLLDASHNLFYNLRVADDNDVDIIFCEGFEQSGLGVGIMNRLTKASSGNVTILGGKKWEN
ncbi:MAG: L-threonylcarbamoyladenylate synthase [Peptoniphilus duerdenii]|uniref:L-threonylcarbamoyladenylate synthase n=1 Tax=Peptoniphilus duerdenii TaxID=507750 RepID=UPI00254EC44D|nr:L-threonylcarbamoyladenylate synthase [Peptoniphilus duerdenii]MDK8275440.1 L-threonylcarbamoyladenylate synthase [Peptoniphilus duerdenii]